MFSTFQLGFKNFIKFSSFAARTRFFRVRAFVPLRVRVMAPKRRLSSSSMPGSSISEDKIDKKLKGLGSSSPNSDKVDGGKSKMVESMKDTEDGLFKGVMNDPGKINAMTVQQLRVALRSAGVPAKGCKSDLVSALKSYLDKQLDDESSHSEDEQVSSVAAESISLATSKLTSEDHIEDSSTVLEASRVIQNKKSVIRSTLDDKAVEVDTNVAIKKQKITTKRKASEKTLSKTTREASLAIDVKEIDGVNVPEKPSEPWTVFAHKKPQKGWIAYNPKVMRPPPLSGDTKSVKLMSWNVNGLRALLKLEGFSALELAKRENLDVLCLQETKLQEKDVESIKESLMNGYDNSFWTCSVSKLGYSGTAIISRIKPLSVRYGLGISDHDSEGRLVTAEFDNFYLICAYVPNSGDGLRRLTYRITEWDTSLSNYIKELEKSKPVILTGDLNCAHEEIDIYNPAGNRRSAGFTNEERESFGTNFLSKGFVDTYRKQHPNVVGYTYWGYRHGGRKTNKGWRLDYFLVSESIADKVHDSYILPDVGGSDHCPIGLVLKV